MSTRRRKAELVTARMLSPSVRSLVFRCTDGEALAFHAGQYVDLFVPTARFVEKRPYSIASPPRPHERPGAFEIAVTRVEGGAASTAIHSMEIGTRVEFEG